MGFGAAQRWEAPPHDPGPVQREGPAVHQVGITRDSADQPRWWCGAGTAAALGPLRAADARAPDWARDRSVLPPHRTYRHDVQRERPAPLYPRRESLPYHEVLLRRPGRARRAPSLPGRSLA